MVEALCFYFILLLWNPLVFCDASPIEQTEHSFGKMGCDAFMNHVLDDLVRVKVPHLVWSIHVFPIV